MVEIHRKRHPGVAAVNALGPMNLYQTLFVVTPELGDPAARINVIAGLAATPIVAATAVKVRCRLFPAACYTRPQSWKLHRNEKRQK